MIRSHRITALFTLGALMATTALLEAQPSAFTYQGLLTHQGAPANEAADFEFRLFNTATLGSQKGTTVSMEDIAVANGVFTVALDFGATVFDGGDRWLSISVRPGNSLGAFTELQPRQHITAAPYALAAGRVLEGGLASGEYGEKLVFSNSGNSFSGNYEGDGGQLVNLSANAINQGTLSDKFLSSNVALRNSPNTFNGTQIIQGSLGLRTSPTADLHVRGQGTNGTVLITPNVSDSRSQLMLSENTSGSLGMIFRYEGDRASNPLHLVGRYTGGTETELLTVERNGGNMGVGTNDPAFKLHVAGSLRVEAGATRLTINPDGSVVIDSASTVSISSAGALTISGAQDVSIGAGRDLSLTAARNTFLTSSNLDLSINSDMHLDVNRLLSITNGDTHWRMFGDLAIAADSFTLDVQDDVDVTAENITFNARSNVNVNAVTDVVIKGSKINQN